MVKGKFYDAYLAYNEEQVRMNYNKISAKWGVPVIIQEFIKGTEVNVVALGDGKGNTIGAVFRVVPPSPIFRPRVPTVSSVT